MDTAAAPPNANPACVINCVWYDGTGRRHDLTLDELSERMAGDAAGFAWVGLYEPSDAVLCKLQEELGLHPLAVEDATKAKQLPKVEVYGDQLFIIASTGNLGGGTIQSGETAIFVGRHFIVTVRHGSARAHSEVRARLESYRLEARQDLGRRKAAVPDIGDLARE